MNLICISFENFKKHCLDFTKRIYYFLSGNDIYLYIISDGILIKSYVDISLLTDVDQFFGDKIFVGAIRLLFNIVDDENTVLQGVNPFTDIITKNKSEEGENKDLQKEGIGV